MIKKEKPIPIVSPWAKPFWDATAIGILKIQKCSKCDMNIFYPRLYCPSCGSKEIEWIEALGTGNVYSFTVVENNAPSAFIVDMPYVVAVVELDEGIRMLTNIINCNLEQLTCDMRVKVVFERLNDEFTLPKFEPAS
jgi:uncharacterized OB-fold protein|tara:strand:- start:2987 stop:3397 length:411 start_codon:yes stop_codon:yes gene_type:complete